MNVTSIALTGVNNTQAAFESAAKKLSGTTGDVVDLSTAAVGLIQAKNSFEANIDVLKKADEIEKSTLSLLG